MPEIIVNDGVIPIKIRKDVTVFIQGIPFDLSEKEAVKIANVILALGGKNDP